MSQDRRRREPTYVVGVCRSVGELRSSPVIEFPDKAAYTTWLQALYGATMLSVQVLEQSIGMVYAVANVDPQRKSNASLKRQWREATARSWKAFQQGTAGMKLNDARVGLQQHLDPQLYTELDAFVSGPRNQLAHRFLVERIVAVDREGLPALAEAAAELLEANVTAKQLSDRLIARANEIRATWPETEDPPREVKEHLDVVARATLLKQFPQGFIEQARAAQRERSWAAEPISEDDGAGGVSARLEP